MVVHLFNHLSTCDFICEYVNVSIYVYMHICICLYIFTGGNMVYFFWQQ